MQTDSVIEVGVDATGRLYVAPVNAQFPHVHLEAMEIGWDPARACLYAPPPPRAMLATRAWWFGRILTAAQEQGCVLALTGSTRWRNLTDAEVATLTATALHV